MLVALNLPNYGVLGTRDAVVSIAEAAEGLGYESVWTTDHVLVPNSLPADFFASMLESLVTLSFIAARPGAGGQAGGDAPVPEWRAAEPGGCRRVRGAGVRVPPCAVQAAGGAA